MHDLVSLFINVSLMYIRQAKFDEEFFYLVVNSLVVYHFFFFLMVKDVLILYFLRTLQLVSYNWKPNTNRIHKYFSQVFKLRYWRKQFKELVTCLRFGCFIDIYAINLNSAQYL